MFPMKVEIDAGTLNIVNYNFEKDEFVGDNGKTYHFDRINYFIIPKEEMQKIIGMSNELLVEESPVKINRNRNYSK